MTKIKTYKTDKKLTLHFDHCGVYESEGLPRVWLNIQKVFADIPASLGQFCSF